MLGTKGEIFSNIVLFLLAMFLSLPKVAKSIRGTYCLAVISAFLFCLFSFWGGDYFHYYSSFSDSFVDTHVEPVYSFLAQKTPTYTIWRAIVWGTSLLIVLFVFNKLEINNYYLFFTFVIIGLLDFSYGRFSLCLALIVLGYYLLSKKKQIVFGFALFVVSFFFHKTAIFGVAIALVALVVPLNSFKHLVLYSVFFGIASYLISVSLSYFMSFNADSDVMLGAVVWKGQMYLENEDMLSGFGGKLRDYLDKTPLYLSLILYLMMVVNKKITEIPKNIVSFGGWSALLIITASLFTLSTDFYTNVMYERFLQFSVIPTAVFIAYCYCNKLYPKYVKVILSMAIISSLYTLLYAYHCAKV